jgi:4-carboxymuconolactone decarboxylase
MSNARNSLGGRLPLLDPGELSKAQKPLYDRIARTMIAWADRSGFQGADDAGHLIGPFNPLLYSPASTEGWLSFIRAEEQHGTLSERERCVVTLTVGSVWKAVYQLYAQSALARKAGITVEAIAALIAGNGSGDLTDKEKIAQRFTRQLITTHVVDDTVYSQTRDAFGDRGVVDICYVAGRYLTVSALLRTFDVPGPK